MKTRKTILFYYALGLASLFIIYLLWNIDDTSDMLRTKPVYIQEKIYPTYYAHSLRSEWLFNISKNYNEANIYRWSEASEAKRIVHPTGQSYGENGSAFIPTDDLKELMDQLLKQENFNLLASDMISLHRSIPDYSSAECKRLSYPDKLPNTSVVIIFHNEKWTTILRTVWSVIERSPQELINEIILVDDASTEPCLKRPLDDYIDRMPLPIRIIRTAKREGLIRARLIGANHATGTVLTFFDAHIECNVGWLQPLVARIASDRSVVAVPAIDAISSHDMSYFHMNTTINGFRESLIFNWMPVPERELIRTHYDTTAPLLTPTMIGCAFSIDREFFFEIGSYDERMDIWGSENLEMSLRVWQCGGSVEIIPCSHVAHLFRISTYSFDGDEVRIKERNQVRLVEVWMSDVKQIYYAAHPYSKNISPGDLTDRIELKKRLNCKDFRWYLKNIYPESIYRKEFIDFVQIKNIKENLCIDTHPGRIDTPLAMFGCHGQRGNQLLFLTKDQMIITRKHFCFGVDNTQRIVKTVPCQYNDSRWWKYENETKFIVHIPSGQCMQAMEGKVMLGQCESANANLYWEIESTP